MNEEDVFVLKKFFLFNFFEKIYEVLVLVIEYKYMYSTMIIL